MTKPKACFALRRDGSFSEMIKNVFFFNGTSDGKATFGYFLWCNGSTIYVGGTRGERG